MSDSRSTLHRLTSPLIVDSAIIATISLFTAFLSGAQRWTGFNSPDSEFYASLALFGNDVSDRSIDPAYTWTRLGYIAPVRALVWVTDPWIGFAIWRLLLIGMIVGAVYATVRLVSTRQLAVILALLASLNTMVLSYVGNTYLTGSILAATSLLLATGVWGALGDARRRWLPATFAGLLSAWLIMLNPYGFLLGVTMWLGLRTLQLVSDGPDRWRAVGRDVAVWLGSFAACFAAFLLAGLRIFPGRNWFETYVSWNARLDYSSFIGDRDVWQRDIALLIPVSAVLLAVCAIVARRASRPSVAALVVAGLNIAFTAVYFILVPGPWLEAPHYVAKLWAGGLVAIALAFASIVGRRQLGVLGWLLASVTVVATLWAGRWDQTLSGGTGLIILGLIVASFAVASALSPRPPVTAFAVAVVIAIAAVSIGAQLLQNGRGLLGIYGQYTFDAAFADKDAETLMRAKVEAEQFVLSQTTSGDRLGIWTDPDRLGAAVAAMQLWGAYNNVTGGATLSREDVAALETVRPSAIAMYAPNQVQIDDFWVSLPPWSSPSDPECTAIPYVGIGSGDIHVCVTHLTWLT